MVLNDESSSGDEGGWFGGPSVFRYLIVATAFTSVFWIPTSIVAASNGYLMPSPVTFVELVREGFKDSTHVLTALIFSIGV